MLCWCSQQIFFIVTLTAIWSVLCNFFAHIKVAVEFLRIWFEYKLWFDKFLNPEFPRTIKHFDRFCFTVDVLWSFHKTQRYNEILSSEIFCWVHLSFMRSAIEFNWTLTMLVVIYVRLFYVLCITLENLGCYFLKSEF